LSRLAERLAACCERSIRKILRIEHIRTKQDILREADAGRCQPTGGLSKSGLRRSLGCYNKEDIASGRVGRCNQKRRTAMNGYPPRKPKSARRVAFPKWAFVGAIAGAALISACSQPSDSQQTAARQQAESLRPA